MRVNWYTVYKFIFPLFINFWYLNCFSYTELFNKSYINKCLKIENISNNFKRKIIIKSKIFFLYCIFLWSLWRCIFFLFKFFHAFRSFHQFRHQIWFFVFLKKWIICSDTCICISSIRILSPKTINLKTFVVKIFLFFT